MNSVRSNSLSLKYQRFTSPGCKDIYIRKAEFVEKTQFLSHESRVSIAANAGHGFNWSDKLSQKKKLNLYT